MTTSRKLSATSAAVSDCNSLSSVYNTTTAMMTTFLRWLIEHGFMSAPTQYRLYGRRFLQVWWPNQQCQSTEGGWLVIQTCLNLSFVAVHWVTLTFDLAFRWAKVQFKSRLTKSKSKVILLSDLPSPNFTSLDLAICSAKVLDKSYSRYGLSTYLDRSQAELTYLSRSNLHGRDSLSPKPSLRLVTLLSD